MKRNKFSRMKNDQQISEVEDDVVNDNLTDTYVERASADQYKRRWSQKAEFNQVNRWIAVGLYLLLAGIALVVV